MSSDGVEKYKLGQLADITSSKRIFLSDYVPNGVPFYRSKEIIQKSLGEELNEVLYISDNKFSEIKQRFGSPKDGDLLLSAVGERAGIPYVVKDDGDFYFKDGNLIWFRSIDEKLNIDYLCYWLKSFEGQHTLRSIMIGSAQRALTIIGLKELEVALPSPDKQKKIATILSSLDDKIELNRQINQTLEAIAQALFKEWFVDFNFPGATGEMQDSELGAIPKGWKVGCIGDLFELQRGFDLPATERIEGSYPVIAASGLNGFHNEFKIKAPGITTGRSGVLGNVFYIQEDFWPLNTSLFIKAFKEVTPIFSFFTLRGIDLKGMNGGSAVPTLNRNEVHKIKIVVPSKSIIELFEKVTIPIFQQIKNNEEQINTLTQLRDSLLPKLMKGEIQLNLNQYAYNSDQTKRF